MPTLRITRLKTRMSSNSTPLTPISLTITLLKTQKTIYMRKISQSENPLICETFKLNTVRNDIRFQSTGGGKGTSNNIKSSDNNTLESLVPKPG